MELIFVDVDLITTYQAIIGPGTKGRKHSFVCCDINNIATPAKPVDFIVSPANSHGIMNGGIDEVYMRMFPGIQTTVQKSIKNIYPDTKMLPVGECLSVEITEMRRCKPPCMKELICCPTMETPQDIRGTDNVYQAMKGLLYFLKERMTTDKRTLKVVIPGMGTATGKLPFDESAQQILQALNEV